MTFEELRTRWPWRPIRNCPGRLVLPRLEPPVSFEMLLGMPLPCSPEAFSSPEAKDRVLVWPLHDGGLIAYEQPDGRLIHTLNTPAGFSRKLAQLGIALSETKNLLNKNRSSAGTTN
ncbi:MAG: hypothetical protein ABIU05_20420 [Nitrospirales bacterium]